jgi:hypothetical protein
MKGQCESDLVLARALVDQFSVVLVRGRNPKLGGPTAPEAEGTSGDQPSRPEAHLMVCTAGRALRRCSNSLMRVWEGEPKGVGERGNEAD